VQLAGKSEYRETYVTTSPLEISVESYDWYPPPEAKLNTTGQGEEEEKGVMVVVVVVVVVEDIERNGGFQVKVAHHVTCLLVVVSLTIVQMMQSKNVYSPFENHFLDPTTTTTTTTTTTRSYCLQACVVDLTPPLSPGTPYREAPAPYY